MPVIKAKDWLQTVERYSHCLWWLYPHWAGGLLLLFSSFKLTAKEVWATLKKCLVPVFLCRRYWVGEGVVGWRNFPQEAVRYEGKCETVWFWVKYCDGHSKCSSCLYLYLATKRHLGSEPVTNPSIWLETKILVGLLRVDPWLDTVLARNKMPTEIPKMPLILHPCLKMMAVISLCVSIVKLKNHRCCTPAHCSFDAPFYLNPTQASVNWEVRSSSDRNWQLNFNRSLLSTFLPIGFFAFSSLSQLMYPMPPHNFGGREENKNGRGSWEMHVH